LALDLQLIKLRIVNDSVRAERWRIGAPFRQTPHDAAHLRRIADTYDETVGRHAAVALYVLTLVAVVVGVDVLFFKHHFLERLIAKRRHRPCVCGVRSRVPARLWA